MVLVLAGFNSTGVGFGQDLRRSSSAAPGRQTAEIQEVEKLPACSPPLFAEHHYNQSLQKKTTTALVNLKRSLCQSGLLMSLVDGVWDKEGVL